jgi:hypothetical protein
MQGGRTELMTPAFEEIAMSFRITGLDPAPFRPLYGLPNIELARLGVKRCRVDATPGFPDRVEMRDAEPGESVLLLNYVHQPADTPYKASHAVFVREGAERAYEGVDEAPECLRLRMLSLRAFDPSGDMVDAELADGRDLEAAIERLFANPPADYIHAHYAKRGCYAARIDRA